MTTNTIIVAQNGGIVEFAIRSDAKGRVRRIDTGIDTRNPARSANWRAKPTMHPEMALMRSIARTMISRVPNVRVPIVIVQSIMHIIALKFLFSHSMHSFPI